MLNNNRNRVTGTDPDRRDTRDNTGAMIIGALAVAAVVGALFMWAPWSSDRTASNTSPGTTVGSSTTPPAAPAAPAAREPAVPAAPTTTR